MATIRPFRALRPPADRAGEVASLPYDVMDVAEARAMAAGNDASFLHISRPEIDLPDDVDPYDDAVYAQGCASLDEFVRRGVLVLDDGPTFSVYRQRMGDHVQTGIVGLASIDDYESGVIAKHELTRPDKELDRVRHIDALGAQDEPVFLLSPRHEDIESVIADVITGAPDVEIVTDDGITHTLWIVSDPVVVARLVADFAEVPGLYVADGHHRTAAAARVRELREQRADRSADARDDGILAVVFAADEVSVLPYNRLVTDLAGRKVQQLLEDLRHAFDVVASNGPPATHVIGMYVPGQWYSMTLRAGMADESDPVDRLDVSVLQDVVLKPLLGIADPRTDKRLRFVGGIRGTAELERLVDCGDNAVAFALPPTSVADLMAVADEGRMMPPKSTWFEPKLRSGLFAYKLT